MAIRQLPSPRWTVPGASGAVAAGYYVYTYQPGTTTPKATYTDYTGATPNSNPIVLDARGEEEIWWDGQYKVAVYTGDKDAGGSLVWTQDNYGEGTSSVLQGNFNLVLNGSFEQDTNGDGEPDDWTVVEYTGSGGVTLDSTEQIHGLYSLKFTSTGSGGGYATSDYFEVQGSRAFAVSFSILASVATVHNQVDIIWYTAAKAVISTSTLYDDTATNPTSWIFKSYSATAPATARYARVRLYGCKDDDAQAGSTWFDNVVADAAASGLFPNVNGEVSATDEELSYASSPNTANKFLKLGSDAKVPFAQKSAFRGALVYLSGSQTVTSGVYWPIAFDAEVYDTDSLHDNVTNPSRITIPSGVTKVRFTGQVAVVISAGGNSVGVNLVKNSTVCAGGIFDNRIYTATSYGINTTSGILEVTAGDYFQFAVIPSGTSPSVQGNVTGDLTWLCVEIIE